MEKDTYLNPQAVIQKEGSSTSPGHSKSGIFQGPIAPTALKLGIPMLVSQLVVFACYIVDTYFVSLIDKESTALVSAMGLVYPIYLFFSYIGYSLFLGMSSLIARSIGQKNAEAINKTGDSGILLIIVIGIITCTLNLLFGREILYFFAGSKLTAETLNYATDYFCYLLPGMQIVAMAPLFTGILQGEGLAKYVGVANIILPGINMILNPLLIFTFHMGIKGSALATSIAAGCTLLYLVFLFVSKKTTIPIHWNIFNADIKLIKEILYISIPAFLGMLISNISIALLNNVVGSISQVAMNAWVLVSRTDQLFLIPAFAVGVSAITMIGQNYGRRNLQRATKIFRVDVALCLAICTFLALCYVIFAPEIFRLLSSVPTVIENSTRQVRLLAFTTIGFAIRIPIGMSFQATGKTWPSLIMNAVYLAIVALPLSLPVFHIVLNDMTPVFITVGAANISVAFIACLWGWRHFNNLESHR